VKASSALSLARRVAVGLLVFSPFAGSQPASASPAVFSASLQVVWRVAQPHGEASAAVASPDGKTLWVADSAQVTARSIADGHVRWRNAALGAPVALAGTRVVGVRGSREIVAVDGATGREGWKTAMPDAVLRSIAADASLVVVTTKDRIFGLSAASGVVLWSTAAQERLSAVPLYVLPHVVVRNDGMAEAPEPWIELFDRRTGSRVYSGPNDYDGPFGGTIWTTSWQGGNIGAGRYDRVRDDGTLLSPYIYSLGADQDTESTSYQDRQALTDRFVYIETSDGPGTLGSFHHAKLYRYDRATPPDQQTALPSTVNGALFAVIGENLMLQDGDTLRMLEPYGNGKYAERVVNTSVSINPPSLLTTPYAAYFSAYDGRQWRLLGVSLHRALLADWSACMKPSVVVAVARKDVVALCDNALVRLRMSAP
jgi:PQQ-like domain